MPYNEALDALVTQHIANWGTTRKKMFGGTCHILHGNMVCGVYKDFLILRLGKQRAEEALKQPFVTEFDITGRPMKDWVMVAQEGIKKGTIDQWLNKARSFVETLPPK